MSKTNIIDRSKLADAIMRGAVGVAPTDTVYGLVARAVDEAAVTRLYNLKNRVRKPGTLVAASMQQVRDLGFKPGDVDRAARFWPGPVSVVMPVGMELSYLSMGTGSLAVRVVANEAFAMVLRQTGPLMTSSANAPGEPGAVDLATAWNYFGELADFYVDGGNLSSREPSAVVQLRPDGTAEVLRSGHGLAMGAILSADGLGN